MAGHLEAAIFMRPTTRESELEEPAGLRRAQAPPQHLRLRHPYPQEGPARHPFLVLVVLGAMAEAPHPCTTVNRHRLRLTARAVAAAVPTVFLVRILGKATVLMEQRVSP